MSQARCSINALRPLPRIIRRSTPAPISAINQFHGLDESQEYDSGTVQSLNYWAHAVNTDSSKPKVPKVSDSKLDRTVNYINGPKKATNEPNYSSSEIKHRNPHRHQPVPIVHVDNEPTIAIQTEKDVKKHEAAVQTLMAALPSSP